MKKLIIPVILLIGFLFGCATTKKAITEENQEGQTKQDTSEITSEKQKEFEYLFIEALKEKMIGNPQRAVALLSSCLEN